MKKALLVGGATWLIFLAYLAVCGELGALARWFMERPNLELVWAILILLPLHEFIHAVAFPGFFLGKSAVFGCLPEKGAFYAFCTVPMSRRRWLTVAILPFVVLSVVPLLLLPWVPELRIAAPLAFLNCIGSGADLLYGWVVFKTVPKDAWLQVSESNGFWGSGLIDVPPLSSNAA